MIPEIVSIREASKRTGASYNFISKLCKQKKIICFKSGTKYLINFGSLVEFLNTGEKEGIVL